MIEKIYFKLWPFQMKRRIVRALIATDWEQSINDDNIHNRYSSGKPCWRTENNVHFSTQVPDGTTQTTITTITKTHTILVRVTATIAETASGPTTASEAEGADVEAPATLHPSQQPPRRSRTSTTSRRPARQARPPSACRRPRATTTCTRSRRRRPQPPSSPLNRAFI